MSNGIRVSEKYGVNPSMQICFFCRKTKGIALLGKLKDDVEAPREVLLDYEPCEECAENFKRGVLLIEADTQPVSGGQPCICKKDGKELYPTGPFCLMAKEAVERIFGITDSDKILCEKGVIQDLTRRHDEAVKEAEAKQAEEEAEEEISIEIQTEEENNV